MSETGKVLEVKMEDYKERSNEGAITDSQDEFDHGVCPKDPNVMGYQKKLRLVFVILVMGIWHADA